MNRPRAGRGALRHCRCCRGHPPRGVCTPARSAVIHSDRVTCIYATAWLWSQETMSSDSIQGACADVRHSTHAGHSTDRPSHARVAESCRSFYGITSSACPKHVGVWQAAAHAWRASAIGGLTSPGRAVRCTATRGGSARVRTRTHRVMGCMTVRMGRWGGTVASGIVRGAIVALGSM